MQSLTMMKVTLLTALCVMGLPSAVGGGIRSPERFLQDTSATAESMADDGNVTGASLFAVDLSFDFNLSDSGVLTDNFNLTTLNMSSAFGLELAELQAATLDYYNDLFNASLEGFEGFSADDSIFTISEDGVLTLDMSLDASFSIPPDPDQVSSVVTTVNTTEYLDVVSSVGDTFSTVDAVTTYHTADIKPTDAPTTTVSPSVSPTLSAAPTVSAAPSYTPTSSQLPTTSPQPTSSPSSSPSTSPTAGPTSGPTMVPSALPTDSPTLGPTEGPTMLPTMSPTTSPTTVPTSAPTLSPTVPGATANPTATPTTAAPTTNPTATPTTAAPTTNPTATPTTEAPTTNPTATPTTEAPTTNPTTAPVPPPTPPPQKPPPTDSPTLAPIETRGGCASDTMQVTTTLRVAGSARLNIYLKEITDRNIEDFGKGITEYFLANLNTFSHDTATISRSESMYLSGEVDTKSSESETTILSTVIFTPCAPPNTRDLQDVAALLNSVEFVRYNYLPASFQAQTGNTNLFAGYLSGIGDRDMLFSSTTVLVDQ